ncbi:hypothetical protein MMC07_004505 [Pseudocyphellaria aurata]|nr:hypothetical protein [Pseudocyphellaria aurata]
MKLDTKALRYLTTEDWRVLTAVEIGSKNHEVVPTPLIIQLSGLRGGSGAHKCISTLAKTNLIARVKGAKYDGYRLTYGGLDYLALHTHQKRHILYSTGQQIGTGKESDIHITASPSGTQCALKIHRLGRISFRSVKKNRDYLRHRSSASWMYMSRLAAVKEFAFLTVLHENGFPVPRPVGQNRHTLVMELIEGLPLRQIPDVPHPERLYAELIDLILKLASVGLIHGDFNEFNILIREDTVPSKSQESSLSLSEPTIKLTPIVIDFPQMLSVDHANAEMYFDRDVACIKRFFQRRFHFTSDEPGPFFADARPQVSTSASRPSRNSMPAVAADAPSAGNGQRKRGRKGMVQEGHTAKDEGDAKNRSQEEGERAASGVSRDKVIRGRRLDVEVEASGFSRQMAKELEKYMRDVEVDGDGEGVDGDDRSDLEVSADEEPSDLSETEAELPDATIGLDHDQRRTSPAGMSVSEDRELRS